ncbi:molybdopterin cofactor-binding domain-containing protein, partial [Escherichia coli]|uniref:molybdopterin cofactor-binding domain-containing protein n=1 Tax=Escherichia coli TaxID=562 RepID=UPI003F4AF917
MAAFLTSKLGGIPVKVSLSREEGFLATRTRHAFPIACQIGRTPTRHFQGLSAGLMHHTGLYCTTGAPHPSCG